MKKLIYLLASFYIIFLSIITANACSCIQPLAPSESLENATAVFVGRVVEINEPKSIFGLWSGLDPIEVEFEVNRSYKGVTNSNVTIETPMSSASCWFPFIEGEEYLVYANWEENNLDVSLCSRTALLSDATVDINELGEGNIVDNTDGEVMPDNNNYLVNILISFLVIVLIISITLILIRNKDKNK